MKSFVNALAWLVGRAPWAVIIVTVAVALVLGSFAGKYQPSDDPNDGFAPDAPELVAAEAISEQFGGDTNQSVMQIIVSSDAGDVITLDGLASIAAVRATIENGPVAPYLSSSPDQPPIVSYLSPVEQAVAFGAPAPVTDDDVKSLYAMAYGQMPEEQQGFVGGMLPSNADRSTLVSPSGLMISFTVGDFEDLDYIEASTATAEAIAAGIHQPGTLSIAGENLEGPLQIRDLRSRTCGSQNQEPSNTAEQRAD